MWPVPTDGDPRRAGDEASWPEPEAWAVAAPGGSALGLRSPRLREPAGLSGGYGQLLSCNSKTVCVRDAAIVPTAQTRKLRLGDQGHTLKNGQSPSQRP